LIPNKYPSNIQLGDNFLFAPEIDLSLNDLLNEYENDEYNVSSLKGNSVAIDIGASYGDFAIKCANQGAQVYCFEPNKEVFKYLCWNIDYNNFNNRITPVNFAISEKSGEAKFVFKNHGTAAGAILDFYAGNTANKNIYKVRTIDVNSILCLFNKPIDLLKIDAEGAEYSIIGVINPKYFKGIKEIYVEYHQGPKEIPQILEKNGYRISDELKKNQLGIIHAIRSEKVTKLETILISNNSDQLPRIGVLIRQWDNFKLTNNCIDSILSTSYNNLDLYLIDDASEDLSYLQVKVGHPSINIIRFNGKKEYCYC